MTPEWVTALTIIAALSAPVVAIFAAVITYWQVAAARNTLKLALFDRRGAVYDAVNKVIGLVLTAGEVTQAEQERYMIGVQGAKWLFDDDVLHYVEVTLWHKIINLETLNNMLANGGGGAQRGKMIQDRAEIKKWIVDQRPEVIALFAPYLRLDHKVELSGLQSKRGGPLVRALKSLWFKVTNR